MANEEQLSILKQGVEIWNKWREENLGVHIDLQRADLLKADLAKANLTFADLSGTNLIAANLSQAALRDANLRLTSLNFANLQEVDFSYADLNELCVLYGADLRGANLRGTNLNGAFLFDTNFAGAIMGGTVLADLDLSKALGLEKIVHNFPSSLSTDTFANSKGKISPIFLRGCGLSDWEIEAIKLYDPELTNNERNQILYRIYDVQTRQAIQLSPLFISYSHGDHKFVDKIDEYLTEKGVRFWRDIHDLKAGRIERQIDQAISQGRTVLLVLSENSLSSDWVEHEVMTARELEKDIGRDLLCPVALDDSWKDGKWEKRLMEQVKKYNILDFSAWEDDSQFETTFKKLINGLELFYERR